MCRQIDILEAFAYPGMFSIICCVLPSCFRFLLPGCRPICTGCPWDTLAQWHRLRGWRWGCSTSCHPRLAVVWAIWTAANHTTTTLHSSSNSSRRSHSHSHSTLSHISSSNSSSSSCSCRFVGEEFLEFSRFINGAL